MTTATGSSLRERKKAKTRETIVRVALGLFAEQGYNQTTIARIAEAADVSPRTVSTYFPAKEDIVFDVSAGTRDRLADTIRLRPAGQDTMSALRQWVLEERKLLEHDQDLHARQRLVIDREELLAAHEQAMMREFEVILAEGLSVDLGLDPSDLQSRMAAAAAMAVFDLLHDEGSSKRAAGELPPVEQQLRMLDQALAFITAGVGALREHGG